MDILIFEDEIPSYEKILDLISKYLPNAVIKGWARSIMEGKRFLEKFPDVDLIFSDIELLDGNSFNIFDQIKISCPIIFSTAYNEYILKAFQTNGIAYLLKPYNEKQFEEAIEKYETLFAKNGSLKQETASKLKSSLKKKTFKQRFTIKRKGGIKLMSVDQIVGFQANGDFSFALDKDGQKHPVNYPLGAIETKTDPSIFFRINRSVIVNINFILKIEPYFKNRLSIHLEGRNEAIHTSTSRTPEFRDWIE